MLADVSNWSGRIPCIISEQGRGIPLSKDVEYAFAPLAFKTDCRLLDLLPLRNLFQNATEASDIIRARQGLPHGGPEVFRRAEIRAASLHVSVPASWPFRIGCSD